VSYTLIDTPIQTEKSFLKTYSFSDENLIKNSVAETLGKLNKSSRRNVGFFSNAYKGMYYYGKIQITKSQPLTPSLQTLLLLTNDTFASDCNGIIVNEYKNGKFYIEKHSDSKNHSDIGVIIISYGATRNFRVFDKISDTMVANIPLLSNSAIYMGGDFQEEFTHDIEQDLSITSPRYSFSFHKYMGLGLYDEMLSR